jgi:hypothetical protein
MGAEISKNEDEHLPIADQKEEMLIRSDLIRKKIRENIFLEKFSLKVIIRGKSAKLCFTLISFIYIFFLFFL